jgi:hypothetical protein
MLARRLLAVAAVVLLAAPVRAHDWNDKNIAWKSLDDGLAEAKKEKKPICLIVYTEWCPHCANYAKVFADPKIVEKSKSFVMIHVDQDKDKVRAKNYAPDGGYIPRTMFLTSDGTIDKDIHAPREQFKYFYNEQDPASVGAGMDAAIAKLAPKK